jgi:hypothetical protein
MPIPQQTGVINPFTRSIEPINSQTWSDWDEFTVPTRTPKTVTAFGDAAVSSLQNKFGGASLALDGVNGSYAFVQSNTDFAFETGDFTIEMWTYRNASGVFQYLAEFRTAGTQVAPLLYINTSNNLVYFVNGAVAITGSTVPLATWTHVAISRNNNSTRMFINGVQTGATYTDNNNYIQSPLTIGARFNGTLVLNGFIDELRITKGTARYTANFTPPTAAFVNDQDTVLLLHFDSDLSDDGGIGLTQPALSWNDLVTWNPTATELLWISDPIDLTENKTVNLVIETSAQGRVEYDIISSVTGAFSGEETTVVISANTATIPAFSGRYFYIVAKVTNNSGLPILDSMNITTTVNKTTKLTLSDIDTSTLAGTVSARVVDFGRAVSGVKNMQITVKSTPDYTMQVYVTDYPTSNTVIARIVDKTVPSIALVGLDNVPRDATVDIIAEILPEQFLSGNNLLIR